MPNCDHLADAPHFVYRVIGSDGRLLYVGCTSRPTQRRSAHRHSRWARLPHTVQLVGPFTGKDARQRALRFETRVIETERPLFNVQTRGRLGVVRLEDVA